ncbi:MAG: hypothetical protein ACK5P5_12805 [Pseudobdellovibrionaceae bacterium]
MEFKKTYCLIFLFLQACSSVRVQIPYAEVSSPQINEAKDLSLAFSDPPANSFTLDGVRSRPPNFAEETKLSGVGAGQIRYGLIPGLELGGGVLWPSGQGFFDVGFLIKGKFQILGQQSAFNESPLMLSVFAHYKHLSGQSSGDQKTAGGSGGYPWKASLASKTTDYGASLGYLISLPSILPYVGYSEGRGTAELKLDQNSNASNEPDPGGSWERSYDVETKTTALGLSFVREKWNFDLQYQWHNGTVATKNINSNAVSAVFNVILK